METDKRYHVNLCWKEYSTEVPASLKLKFHMWFNKRKPDIIQKYGQLYMTDKEITALGLITGGEMTINKIGEHDARSNRNHTTE